MFFKDVRIRAALQPWPDSAALIGLLALLVVMFFAPWAAAQHEHHHPAPGNQPEAAAKTAPDPRPEFFRGKSFSEFNHRVAGVFVLLAGVAFALHGRLQAKWPATRYAWPVCLLLPGAYLLIFSDPRWPFGPKSLLYHLTNSAEFLQHKIYALILLILGIFELGRIQGRFRGRWAPLVFPVFALAGAGMLLVHEHGASHAAHAMELMAQIQMQHLWFAIVGFLIVVAKPLSETQWRFRVLFSRAWPALMVVLGLLLIFYRE